MLFVLLLEEAHMRACAFHLFLAVRLVRDHCRLHSLLAGVAHLLVAMHKLIAFFNIDVSHWVQKQNKQKVTALIRISISPRTNAVFRFQLGELCRDKR